MYSIVVDKLMWSRGRGVRLSVYLSHVVHRVTYVTDTTFVECTSTNTCMHVRRIDVSAAVTSQCGDVRTWGITVNRGATKIYAKRIYAKHRGFRGRSFKCLVKVVFCFTGTLRLYEKHYECIRGAVP